MPNNMPKLTEQSYKIILDLLIIEADNIRHAYPTKARKIDDAIEEIINIGY